MQNARGGFLVLTQVKSVTKNDCQKKSNRPTFVLNPAVDW